jgi:predicted nicotinamide N-methyase
MTSRTFILENTRLLSPPLVPEVKLHLAEESVPIWQKSEEQLGEMNVPPPFWAFAWAGGQAVSRYLLDNRASVAGRSVLDLGAGSGLGAIAAMLAGAECACAADIDALAVEAIALNAEANGVRVRATRDDLLAQPPGSFDVVLIGDLFYERPLAERVLAFAQAARAQGADVLVGDPRRSYFPPEKFVAVAHYEVPVTRELEDSEIKRSAVWRLA